MKTLVIVAHPNIEASVINKRWVEELRKYPEKYTVHELYKAYPDEKIDVGQEQARVEAHGNLVLQFPIHWFNCPPLLKKWLDDVLAYGWAYGSKGDKLKNRKVALAVSREYGERITAQTADTGTRWNTYWFRSKRRFGIAAQIIVRSMRITARKRNPAAMCPAPGMNRPRTR